MARFTMQFGPEHGMQSWSCDGGRIRVTEFEAEVVRTYLRGMLEAIRMGETNPHIEGFVHSAASDDAESIAMCIALGRTVELEANQTQWHPTYVGEMCALPAKSNDSEGL